MKKFLFFLFLLLLIVYNFYAIDSFTITVKEITYLWFTVLVPSLLPLYVLTNFLITIPSGFNLFYYLLNPFYHFENATSTAIFLLSFIVSNPTITILINQALDHNLISINEGNRLMRSTSHLSFIFIYLLVRKDFFMVFLPLFLSSSIIFSAFRIKTDQPMIKISKNHNFIKVVNEVINNGYQVLLKILYIMLFIGFLINFFNFLFPHPIMKIATSFLEVTIGTTNLKMMSINCYLQLLLIVCLLSFNGLSIFLQTINVIHQQLSIKNFVYFRLIHLILSAFLFSCLWIIKIVIK